MKFRMAVLLRCWAAGDARGGLAQQRQAPSRPVKLASRGTRGAVAAGTEYATEAGMRMYYTGGNGGGCRHRHDAGRFGYGIFAFRPGRRIAHPGAHQGGQGVRVAGVGTMPKMATADFFRKHQLLPNEIVDPPEGNGLKDWVPVAGILSALVPGMVDAALVTLRDFGTKSFAEAVEPPSNWPTAFPSTNCAP